MGLGLFGGMLIATLIGIFAYPALFVCIGKIGKYEQKRTAKQQEITTANTMNNKHILTWGRNHPVLWRLRGRTEI